MATAVHQIHICCCISVIALFGGQTTASSNSRPELVFGLITGDREAKAGAEEAVEYINSRSDLLPDFNLKYVPLAVDQAVSSTATRLKYDSYLSTSITYSMIQITNLT